MQKQLFEYGKLMLTTESISEDEKPDLFDDDVNC